MSKRSNRPSGNRSALSDAAVIRAAKIRGKKRKAALLREAGGLVSMEQASLLLGIMPDELTSQTLILIRAEDGSVGYPKFQFESTAIIQALKKVLGAMDVESDWMRLSFFFLRLDELDGRTPVEEIRRGASDAVSRAAANFGHHGAS